MLNGKKICVVMPAYNAKETLEATYAGVPLDIVDSVILVDDSSKDETAELARDLGITTIVHRENIGYGGNQKTCYRAALKEDSDIVVMLHPDYQYTPRLLVAMIALIAYGEYDTALGSRILAQNPMKRGMPVYKYIANRALTFFQNVLCGQKLSEYHTGYRAFSKEVLSSLPLEENSNDFVFDNEMLAQVMHFGFRIGEISCPTHYAPESSSISLQRSMRYGFGVLVVTAKYFLSKRFGVEFRIFKSNGKKLSTSTA